MLDTPHKRIKNHAAVDMLMLLIWRFAANASWFGGVSERGTPSLGSTDRITLITKSSYRV